MGVGFGQILVILFIILILFGAGRLPNVMRDIGKGLKNLRDELKNDDNKLNDEDSKP